MSDSHTPLGGPPSSSPSLAPKAFDDPRDHRLVRIQAISGLVFAIFLSLHLVNVMASALGPGLYDAFQVRIRPLYQFPLVEVGVVIVALVIHVVAGVTRLRRRPRSRDWGRLPLRTRLHRLSAYFLLVFVLGHIAATRLPSLLDGPYVGFAGLSFTMWKLPGYFYPYYLLLGLTGLYHGSYGAYLALRALGVRLPSISRLSARAWGPLAVAAVLVVLGVLSFGGLLYPIDDPRQSAYGAWLMEQLGMEP
jgi:succinate dehydrogenase/fumarate reductase cytochrome b subunit